VKLNIYKTGVQTLIAVILLIVLVICVVYILFNLVAPAVKVVGPEITRAIDVISSRTSIEVANISVVTKNNYNYILFTLILPYSISKGDLEKLIRGIRCYDALTGKFAVAVDSSSFSSLTVNVNGVVATVNITVSQIFTEGKYYYCIIDLDGLGEVPTPIFKAS